MVDTPSSSDLSSRSVAEGSAFPTAATHLPPVSPAPSALDAEISSGSLYASGLIAAGGIMGLVGVCLKIYGDVSGHTAPHFAPTNPLYKDWVSVLAFAALAYSLHHFARKPVTAPETVGRPEQP